VSPTVAPAAPVLKVEPRDCLVCGGNHPAAIGLHGYRCLTCKSEYVNPDTKSPWRSR
jgi:predicted Zn-ribbon and HTH transcriptional regulator